MAGGGSDDQDPPAPEPAASKGRGLWSRAWTKVKPAFGVSDNTESGMAGTIDFFMLLMGDVPLRPFDISAAISTLWQWQAREKKVQLMLRLKALEPTVKAEVVAAVPVVAAVADAADGSAYVSVGAVASSASVSPASDDDKPRSDVETPKTADNDEKKKVQSPSSSTASSDPSSKVEVSLPKVPVCLVMRTGEVVGPKQVQRVKDAHFWSKLACAAYGWKLLYGFRRLRETYAQGDLRVLGVKAFRQKFKETNAENMRILSLHSGLDESDILAAKWTSETAYDTGHFVAVVRSRQTIAVGIRGTFHARDAVTDMNAKYSTFLSGFAHEGILEAARRKRVELEPIVLEALQTFPGYRVVITGHSLGAGTASVLAMMWTDAQTFSAPVECHAFACPPVLSLDLAALSWTKDIITSYVANDDIIPRLSYGSMTDLKQWIVALAVDDTGFFQRSFQLVSVGNTLGAGATSWLSKKFKWSTDFDSAVRRAYQHVTYTERLYLPGRVYFLYKKQSLAEVSAIPGGSGEKAEVQSAPSGAGVLAPDGSELLVCDYDTMEESSAALFEDLVLSPSMFTDHMPDLYEAAFALVLKSIGDGQDESLVTTDDANDLSVVPLDVSDGATVPDILDSAAVPAIDN